MTIPIKYVTAPSTAPTRVISSPLDHHERIVISDLAAPTVLHTFGIPSSQPANCFAECWGLL